MAVKVVGQDPRMVKTVSCKNCSAILQYTLKDTQTRVVSDYIGGRDTIRFITCPACGNEVIVNPT